MSIKLLPLVAVCKLTPAKSLARTPLAVSMLLPAAGANTPPLTTATVVPL